MLYASQLTARHLDQLEQKGDLMGNQQKETEPAKALIDIIINIGTKCFLLGSHETHFDCCSQAEQTHAHVNIWSPEQP